MTAHVRDCLEVAEGNYPGCYDGDPSVARLLKTMMPSSIISTSTLPNTKVCYCQYSGCLDTLTKQQVTGETFCPKGDVKVADIW